DFHRRLHARLRHPAALKTISESSEVVSMLRLFLSLMFLALLGGCMSTPPKPDEPYYAPVLPRTPLPVEQNNGAIYQPGFGMNLFDDRKAYRVGDIITITLNERTQAS